MTTMRALQRLRPLFLYSLLALAICARAQTGDAPNPSGTWTWTIPVAKGIPDRRHVLTLKLEDDALSGTLASPGATRSGSATPVTAVRFAHDTIAFTVTRQFGTNTIIQRFSGTLTNDIIRGTITFEISGKTNSAAWTAKRAPEDAIQEPAGRAKGAVPRPGTAGTRQFPTEPRRSSQSTSPPATTSPHPAQ